MFESRDRAALPEEQFELWLEEGRSHVIGYHFMLILWNELDRTYKPYYLTDRKDVYSYRTSAAEEVVAAYDVYSESRLSLDN